MAKPKLPKTLYIHIENEGDKANEFLSVSRDLKDITVEEQGKRLRVGEYVLQRQVEVVTETIIVTEVG
jgi:mRNA-degrading endonuclease RelE of RelBE toxin-antitoxin system